jgi:hypothetical protein
VAFITEGEVVLTGDIWRAVINFDLTLYLEAFGVLQADLATVEEIADYTTSVGELHHVKTTLTALESKLATVRQFLSTAGRKRGL